MTEEIMPREDRMGKILSFIGGCIAGVVGVFAVAVMSEMSPKEEDVSFNNTKSNCKEEDSVM
ncbi:hypothetical protein [Desulfomicrobium salsuginis]